jgi:hypothetical protein
MAFHIVVVEQDGALGFTIGRAALDIQCVLSATNGRPAEMQGNSVIIEDRLLPDVRCGIEDVHQISRADIVGALRTSSEISDDRQGGSLLDVPNGGNCGNQRQLRNTNPKRAQSDVHTTF